MNEVERVESLKQIGAGAISIGVFLRSHIIAKAPGASLVHSVIKLAEYACRTDQEHGLKIVHL